MADDSKLTVNSKLGENQEGSAHLGLGLRQLAVKQIEFRKMKMLTKPLPMVLLALTLSACSKDSDQKAEAAKDPDWQRGRAVYVANCVACHNNDPSKDGPIGPANKGSSKELLEARVLSTSYPPGYKPKRPTHIMPQFPFLKDEIPYLAAYLR